jgi:hypothetical protein
VLVEIRGSGKTSDEEGGDKHEREGGRDKFTGGRGSRIAELVSEGLYAELEVRLGHVEVEGFAEHIARNYTLNEYRVNAPYRIDSDTGRTFKSGRDPVEDRSPQVDPVDEA